MPPRAAAGLLLAALLGGAACAPFPIPGAPVGSLRISELADAGDPERRTSTALVLQGLDADADRRPDRAAGAYENALRIDPGNPYAYLALARHHVQTGEPERALPFLARAEQLLRAEGAWSPRVEAHVAGLRGAALVELGRAPEAGPWLDRARSLDPWVWGDGRLAAAELR